MTAANGPRAVLWDLDGTLADSEELHWLAWLEVMARESVSVTYDQFQASFGRRNASFLPEWLGSAASEETVARIGGEKEAAFRRLVAERGCRAVPGAAGCVRRLEEAGWRQAIASSAPRANIGALTAALGLDRYIRVAAAAEDVTAGKPDPAIFLAASAMLGVAPSRCVVVEDVAAGVEAARRAGMVSIGLSRCGPPLDATLPVSTLETLTPEDFERLLIRASSK